MRRDVVRNRARLLAAADDYLAEFGPPIAFNDLARYAGVSVTVPSPLAGRRFSGTLSIRDGDSAVRDLAQLMGLALSRDGSAYRLAGGG